MSKIILTPVSVKVVPLVLLLVLVFGWNATAYAQTSADGQYASPTMTASGNPTATGDLPNTETEVTASGNPLETEDTPSIGVLPATGGSLLPLVALATFALGATSLLILWQITRQRANKLLS